ncbi:MAG: MBL fold metallo-hydrolase [Deltaproteobacteria bacterium]|jgi:L-ascorbate 6-phosphate lactonase|nr:MBL fold metallo-hydrolase [Deltaproteobacteria bacterium]
MNLAEQISKAKVGPGQVALFWLGQAGFLLKDSQGHQFVIDPYLTDCGERIKGFKRLTPKLLAPADLRPDLYFVTHSHFDHYDYDAIPIVAKHSQALFCGPKSCVDLFKSAGLPNDRLKELAPGQTLIHHGIEITATKADHGQLAPDALGLLVTMDSRRFFFSGDTAFNPEIIPAVAALKPEVAAVSINGLFGNMNGEEGALLATKIGASLAIPCHFWTFLEHQGAPWTFMESLKNSPACLPICLSQGEMLILEKNRAMDSRGRIFNWPVK